MGPWAAREQAPAPHGASRVRGQGRARGPSHRQRERPLRAHGSSPCLFPRCKNAQKHPGVLGQAPTKLKGSRAAPEGRRAAALVKESTQTGDTAQGRVKPKHVCKVNKVPPEKLL